MPCPVVLGGAVLAPGVERHGAPAGGVGLADHDLQGRGAVVGQCQRRLQVEDLDGVAADLVGGEQGEFHERRARQQGAARDDVVGEPRLEAG
ncbi:hypothetical protein GCM10020295_07950 [Streptomyces cinereospinus]